MNIQEPLNSLADTAGLEQDFYTWLKKSVLDLSIRWAYRQEEYALIPEPYRPARSSAAEKDADEERKADKDCREFAEENFEKIASILIQAVEKAFVLRQDHPDLQTLHELLHINAAQKSRDLTAEQNKRLRMGSAWLFMVFEIRIREGRFDWDDIDCFIREFRLVPIPNRQYVNLAEASELIDFLVKTCALPVNHYCLVEKEIDRLFQTSFQNKAR